ncbi:MAG: formate dehydrogenase family accessory protein FdhD [Planctomycetaceae bacterium]|nr:formate dehydrogenase family accessory protein FdhD [Planctomycetaceae bacterium]
MCVAQSGGQDASRSDWVAVEEPLEIVLEFGPAESRVRRTVSLTMRTPGNDEELAAGFLLAEGVIRTPEEVGQITPCGHPNAVRVELQPGVAVAFGGLERHVTTTSSCGVCGKTSLDSLAVRSTPLPGTDSPFLPRELVHRLPGILRDAQPTFDRTGGLHAAALFDSAGKLLAVREDVGRHNAVDKLIGAEFLAGRLPLTDRVMLVSGRASFELAQKALAAGISVLAAVGAPSSLAVDLANWFGLTLLGFVRDQRFNVYAHPGRLLP